MKSVSAVGYQPEMRRVLNDAVTRRTCPIPDDLSAQYAEHLGRKNRTYILSVILIGAAAFVSFAIADYLVVRDVILQSVTLRLLFSSTILLLSLWLFKRGLGIQWLECLLPIYVHLAVLIWLYLLVTTEAPNVSEFAYASVIFVCC